MYLQVEINNEDDFIKYTEDRFQDDINNGLKEAIYEYYKELEDNDESESINIDELPIEDFKYYTEEELAHDFIREIAKASLLYLDREQVDNISIIDIYSVLACYLSDYENSILIRCEHTNTFALLE